MVTRRHRRARRASSTSSWRSTTAPWTKPSQEIVGRLTAAARPVLIVGVEVHRFRLREQVIALAERLNVPVASSFLGRGVFPTRHPQFHRHVSRRGVAAAAARDRRRVRLRAAARRAGQRHQPRRVRRSPERGQPAHRRRARRVRRAPPVSRTRRSIVVVARLLESPELPRKDDAGARAERSVVAGGARAGAGRRADQGRARDRDRSTSSWRRASRRAGRRRHRRRAVRHRRHPRERVHRAGVLRDDGICRAGGARRRRSPAAGGRSCSSATARFR